MAKDEKAVNFTKESIVNSAKAEVNKEVGEKYKAEYKSLLHDKAKAEKILANINRSIEDLEFKMETELGG